MPIHKLAALAALSLTLTGSLIPAFAQTAPPPMHGPHGGGRMNGGRMNRMGEALGLTDAQKAQMLPILKNARQQGMAIRSDASLTPESRQAKMRALRASVRTQTMAILTPDQKARMGTMRKERREKRKGA